MKPILWSALVVSLGSLGLGACGDDDDGNNAEPVLIEGGGLGGGAIDGRLNVYVIDERTDEPIVGAAVRVGESDDADPLTGSTDTKGLVSFTTDRLAGPQVITVLADGYPASTLFGANAANVTVTLESTEAADFDTATIVGTIPDLPVPATGHLMVAIVSSSQSRELGAPENEIQQPPKVGVPNTTANVCFKVPGAVPGECSWSLLTRTGKQAVVASIIDVDTKGTPADDTDDTTSFVGYAAKGGYDLNAGSTLSGETLDVLAEADLQDVTLSFPSAPAGLASVFGLPLIDLGDEGRVPVFPVTPEMPVATVPKLSGVFAGGSYMVFAGATVSADDKIPASSRIMRDVDFGAQVDILAWLAPPSMVTASGGTYSFGAPTTANVLSAELADAQGKKVWGVVILDGRTSFSLPGLTPDPLPVGEITLRVSALELEDFDPQNFESDTLSDKILATSENETTFDH